MGGAGASVSSASVQAWEKIGVVGDLGGEVFGKMPKTARRMHAVPELLVESLGAEDYRGVCNALSPAGRRELQASGLRSP